MGPADEPTPVTTLASRRSQPDPAAVPDEVHAAALLALEQAGVRHAQLRQHYIEAILEAIAAAGYVLVPGPVYEEWSYRHYDGATSLPRDEKAVRRYLRLDPTAAAVVRQVTEWRPAPARETLPPHIEAALADPDGQYDPAGELLPHLLAFGPPESTQDGGPA